MFCCLHHLVFTILKQSVYPIEFCLEFDPTASVWYQYLLSDAACHHSILWTTQAYFDWIQGNTLSATALFHEAKTLQLLQCRINDPDAALRDTTITVVVTLVMVSALVGHASVVKKHMQGLHQIITLRGGMRELQKNAQLQIKVCRYENLILDFSSQTLISCTAAPTSVPHFSAEVNHFSLQKACRGSLIWPGLQKLMISWPRTSLAAKSIEDLQMLLPTSDDFPHQRTWPLARAVRFPGRSTRRL